MGGALECGSGLVVVVADQRADKTPTPRTRRSTSAVATADREQEKEEPQRALSQSGGGKLVLLSLVFAVL